MWITAVMMGFHAHACNWVTVEGHLTTVTSSLTKTFPRFLFHVWQKHFRFSGKLMSRHTSTHTVDPCSGWWKAATELRQIALHLAHTGLVIFTVGCYQLLTAAQISKRSVGLAKLERRVMKHPQTLNWQQFLSFLLQSVQIYFIPGCFVLSQNDARLQEKLQYLSLKEGEMKFQKPRERIVQHSSPSLKGFDLVMSHVEKPTVLIW